MSSVDKPQTDSSSERTDALKRKFLAIKDIHNTIQTEFDKCQAEKEAVYRKYQKKIEEYYALRKLIISGEKQLTEADLAPVTSLPFADPEKIESIDVTKVLSGQASNKRLI